MDNAVPVSGGGIQKRTRRSERLQMATANNGNHADGSDNLRVSD